MPTQKEVEESGNQVIDLRVPSEIKKGFETVLVYVDGEPGEGSVEFVSPSGKTFVRSLRNGKTTFYFDEAGEWRVTFKDTSKIVKVIEEEPQAPAAAPSEVTGEEPSKQTGLFMVSFAPSQIGLALLLLALLAYLSYAYWWKRVVITKKYDGKRVVITVENRKETLKNVELLDLAPEESEVKTPENAEASDTITGTAIKWKKKELKKGEKWMVSYGLKKADEKNFKPVELKGLNEAGKEVAFFN